MPTNSSAQGLLLLSTKWHILPVRPERVPRPRLLQRLDAALIAFLIGYSEFAIGWLFVESSQNVTLAMAISGIVGRGSQSWSFLAALAILMSLPVVVIFLLLQRQLLDRWLFGAVGVE